MSCGGGSRSGCVGCGPLRPLRPPCKCATVGGLAEPPSLLVLKRRFRFFLAVRLGTWPHHVPHPSPSRGNTDRWRSREAAAVPGPRSLNRPKAMVHGTHGPGPSATPCASTRRVRASIGRLPLPHVPPQWPPPSRRRAWRKTHAPAGAGPGCAFARRCAPRKTRRAQALLWCSARSLLVLCHWVAGSRWRCGARWHCSLGAARAWRFRADCLPVQTCALLSTV